MLNVALKTIGGQWVMHDRTVLLINAKVPLGHLDTHIKFIKSAIKGGFDGHIETHTLLEPKTWPYPTVQLY